MATDGSGASEPKWLRTVPVQVLLLLVVMVLLGAELLLAVLVMVLLGAEMLIAFYVRGY